MAELAPDAALRARLVADELCDAFEAELRAGGQPNLEEYLRDTLEADRSDLFGELVRLELEYRYRRRFPEYAHVLARHLAPQPQPDSFHNARTCGYQSTTREGDSGPPAIPGYQFLDKLGVGGMGVVYKARQVLPNRFVAVKMMKESAFPSEDERRRFRFEAEAVAALKHPGIVNVYEVGEVGGQPFMCLEYLEGGNLAARMRERPYSPREAAALVAGVARAIQHAHDRGVLHRDLKPANILLDTNGQPHVTDFGLAKRIEGDSSLTQTGAIVGTPSYMAPEQARGEKATVQADVWGLGAVLYELLTGVPPFRGDTVLKTLERLTDHRPAVRPRDHNRAVPRDLEAICLKCLEKDPVDRHYASAAALADDLTRFLNNEPVSVQPPGVWDWLVVALRTRPQPSPDYTWPAPLWMSGIVVAQHLAVFAVVQTGRSAAVLWAVLGAGWLALGLAVWGLLLRRFRQLPATERHSTVLAVGHLAAQVVLFVAAGPLAPGEPSRQVLAAYPPLTVLSGLGFFVLGSTNWGRLFPIGLATMAVALLMVAWPDAGPPLFAAVVSFWLVWWGVAKRHYFVGWVDREPGAHEQQPAYNGKD